MLISVALGNDRFEKIVIYLLNKYMVEQNNYGNKTPTYDCLPNLVLYLKLRWL